MAHPREFSWTGILSRAPDRPAVVFFVYTSSKVLENGKLLAPVCFVSVAGRHHLDKGEARQFMSGEIQQQPPPAENAVDPVILQAAMQRLKSEQNLVLAALAGGAAALLGACGWAAVTVATNYQIGWMAVGVGFLVGYAVRSFGKGIDKSFGIVGAAWSLAGCAAGNLLTTVGIIANEQNIPILNILEKLNLEIAASLMQATFNPMDLLFYGIAVYEGYRFSFRQIAQADLMKIG